MDETRFDDLTRMLAAGASRRRVLKGLLGGAGAGALSLVGLRRAGASHGRPAGATCIRDEHCATRYCDPQTRRCGCSPQYGVDCPTGYVCSGFIGGTCQAAPAPGTCGGACAPFYGFPCPDGCVCSGVFSGNTCQAAPEAGTCGGGCAPFYGFPCPDGCVCSDEDDGTCVAPPA